MEPVEYELMASLEAGFWWYRALHAAVAARIQLLPLPASPCILDAGCGTGGLLHYLMEHQICPQAQLIGLEWDARAASLSHDKSDIPIVRGSVNSLPFRPDTFHVILSQDVLYHANVDEAATLQEFHRCLAPGGHLLLNLPAFEWLRSAHDTHVHGVRRYTASRCKILLERHGFKPVRIGYWNSLLFPLMVLQRLTVGKLKQSSDVEPLPAWQDKLFFTVLDFERKLGLQLPFGGSVWAWGTKL